MITKILILMMCLVMVGCVSFSDRKMSIADDLIVVEFRDNKAPKVNMATGIDECRWRGKISNSLDDYEVGVKCKIKINAVFQIVD